MKLIGAFTAATLLIVTIAVLVVSLFIGLMIATAGIAIHRPLADAAVPFACDGEFTIETRRYSLPNGESGETYNFYCRETGSKDKVDITSYTIFLAFCIYSGISFLILWPVAMIIITISYLVARRYLNAKAGENR